MPSWFSLPFIAHCSAISLALDAVIWLFLVILYNVPLGSNSTVAASRATHRSWLLEISQDDMRYGFGVLGYCVWNSDLSGDARCVKKIGWKAKGLAIEGLPGSFNHFSIPAFLLIFPLLNSFIFFSNLLVTFYLPSSRQPPRRGKPRFIARKGESFRQVTALQLRNLLWQGFQAINTLGGMLPVIFYAVAAASKVHNASYGSAWWFCLGSMVALLAAQAFVLLGGLWLKPIKADPQELEESHQLQETGSRSHDSASHIPET